MNIENIRQQIKNSPRLKRLVDFFVMNQTETRPRWYIRLMAPLYQQRAWSSKIYSSVRMDTPPYRRFTLGRKSVIDSFSCINNAMGNIIIGDHTRIGLHNTIIGPVNIGSHVNLAQGVIITALNHNFQDPTKHIDEQGVSTNQINISDDVWIGANAVVLPGVSIGSHAVVAAGAVVTKDIPPGVVVAGTPARIIRQIK